MASRARAGLFHDVQRLASERMLNEGCYDNRVVFFLDSLYLTSRVDFCETQIRVRFVYLHGEIPKSARKLFISPSLKLLNVLK